LHFASVVWKSRPFLCLLNSIDFSKENT